MFWVSKSVLNNEIVNASPRILYAVMFWLNMYHVFRFCLIKLYFIITSLFFGNIRFALLILLSFFSHSKKLVTLLLYSKLCKTQTLSLSHIHSYLRENTVQSAGHHCKTNSDKEHRGLVLPSRVYFAIMASWQLSYLVSALSWLLNKYIFFWY